MAESSEAVLGDIPVIARLSMGSERLRLFLTTTRIIVAHLGKRGLGAAATTSLFGGLSGSVEDLLKSSRESVTKRRLESLSPGKILAADKDNFSIGYDEVVSVDVTETPRTTSITILTKQDKLEFSTGMNFENVLTLVGLNLGSRLVYRRLPRADPRPSH